MTSIGPTSNKSGCFLLALLALTFLVQINCSGLKRIGPDRFERLMESKPAMFVLFYDPRCWHCKQLLARLRALREDLQMNKMPVYMMNCRNNPRYIEDYNLKYFPALSFFKGGELRQIMPSFRSESVNGVAKWLNNRVGGKLKFENHNTELSRVSSGTCLISDFNTWFPKDHVSLLDRDLKYGTFAALALRGSLPVETNLAQKSSMKTLSDAPSKASTLNV